MELCGPKTEFSVEKKIRAFVMIRNQPELLYKVQIERNIRGDLIINDLISPELAHLIKGGCTLEIK